MNNKPNLKIFLVAIMLVLSVSACKKEETKKAAEEVMKRLRKVFTAMVKDITAELGDSKK